MNTELNDFSLLYPAENTQNRYDERLHPNIDMFVLEELGLLDVFNLKNSDLSEYFTSDPLAIRYRNEVFADMLACPPSYLVRNRTLGPPLENNPEIPPSSRDSSAPVMVSC